MSRPYAEGELAAAPDTWWASLGPVGGSLLILSGLGLALWAFLDGPGSHASLIYQAAKIAAIGLVVTGTTLVARRRAS